MADKSERPEGEHPFQMRVPISEFQAFDRAAKRQKLTATRWARNHLRAAAGLPPLTERPRRRAAK